MGPNYISLSQKLKKSKKKVKINYMIILAIETSCDDTCIAILESKGHKKPCFSILSNIVSSQVKIHQKWGGVYPTLAKREHQKNLPLVLKRALSKAKNPKVDLVAVTVGPGLDPCLWTGVNFAKDLAKKSDLSIIPVNHIEAHILANFINEQRARSKEQLFPAICLVVSGGHTQLILMRGYGKYKILGETRDDAAGECFDKIARILGLGYPGGPAIATEAAKSAYRERFSVSLPRPMIYQRNYDFSFSGLKTAVLYNFKSQSEKIRKSKKYIQAISAEAQQAIIDVLIKKTIRAAKDYKAKTIILGGGVSANNELRKQFNHKLKTINYKLIFLVPPKKFCTDNAAMVAVTSYFHWFWGKEKKPKGVKENFVLFDTFASYESSVIEANANLRLE